MRKLIYTITGFFIAFAFIFISRGGPGGADDPIVSLSYLKAIFTDGFEISLENKVQAEEKKEKEQLDGKLGEYITKSNNELMADALIKEKVKAAVLNKLDGQTLSASRQITLNKGERIYGFLGTKMIVTEGKAELFGKEGDVINITRGSVANVGTTAPNYMHYFFAQDRTSGFEAMQDNTKIVISGGASKNGAYEIKNTVYAQGLFDLGLFKGTGEGFELGNKGDRLQGIIMMIRLMGEEKSALAHNGKTPFLDLTGWLEGHKYVGYGFDNGITKGTNSDNTSFSPSMELSPNMYYTFVLRALGYDDSKGDFNWETTSGSKLTELGVITEKDRQDIAEDGLYRDYIVKISYNALNAKLKGSTQTLGEKLISKGVFTKAQLDNVRQYIK